MRSDLPQKLPQQTEKQRIRGESGRGNKKKTIRSPSSRWVVFEDKELLQHLCVLKVWDQKRMEGNS